MKLSDYKPAVVLIIFLPLLSIISRAKTGQGQIFTTAPKYEVRAVWLTTLSGLDWPRRQATDAYSINRQKKELTTILDKLREADVNTVLFQTRIRGTVIYPSAIEPWDGCCSGTPGISPGYDPLAFAIEECHKRGMEIQAWVVAIPVGKWNSLGCKTLRRKYPTLVVRKGADGYIDPGSPLAADYIARICAEITRNYDIDGIHLDYIRYPETWKVTGEEGKARQNITDIVRSIYTGIKEIKPWVKLSCAPIGKYSDLARYSSNGWNALSKGCQDAQGWVRAGIMDQIYPMMYFRGNQFYPFAMDWNENSYGRTVVAGLGIFFLSAAEGNWPVNEVVRQMYAARKNNMGYAFFRSRFFSEDTKGLYTFTKDCFNLYPALVPPMSWANSDRPASPQSIRKVKAAGCEAITWDSVICNGKGGITYNVYASRTYPVDITDARNLIAMRKRENYLTIKGEGNLYYAVTSMNRYGNESPPAQEKHTVRNVINTGYIRNDGSKLPLPDKGYSLDADYIMIKSLTGTIVATYPYKGKFADISKLNEGCYAVYSLNSKGTAHRLGFILVKR